MKVDRTSLSAHERISLNPFPQEIDKGFSLVSRAKQRAHSLGECSYFVGELPSGRRTIFGITPNAYPEAPKHRSFRGLANGYLKAVAGALTAGQITESEAYSASMEVFGDSSQFRSYHGKELNDDEKYFLDAYSGISPLTALRVLNDQEQVAKNTFPPQPDSLTDEPSIKPPSARGFGRGSGGIYQEAAAVQAHDRAAIPKSSRRITKVFLGVTIGSVVVSGCAPVIQEIVDNIKLPDFPKRYSTDVPPLPTAQVIKRTQAVDTTPTPKPPEPVPQSVQPMLLEKPESPSVPVWTPPTVEQMTVEGRGGELPEGITRYQFDKVIANGLIEIGINGVTVDFSNNNLSGDAYHWAPRVKNSEGLILWANDPVVGQLEWPVKLEIGNDAEGKSIYHLHTQGLEYSPIPDSQDAVYVWGGMENGSYVNSLVILAKDAVTLPDGVEVYSQYWDPSSRSWLPTPGLAELMATFDLGPITEDIAALMPNAHPELNADGDYILRDSEGLERFIWRAGENGEEGKWEGIAHGPTELSVAGVTFSIEHNAYGFSFFGDEASKWLPIMWYYYISGKDPLEVHSSTVSVETVAKFVRDHPTVKVPLVHRHRAGGDLQVPASEEVEVPSDRLVIDIWYVDEPPPNPNKKVIAFFGNLRRGPGFMVDTVKDESGRDVARLTVLIGSGVDVPPPLKPGILCDPTMTIFSYWVELQFRALAFLRPLIARAQNSVSGNVDSYRFWDGRMGYSRRLYEAKSLEYKPSTVFSQPPCFPEE